MTMSWPVSARTFEFLLAGMTDFPDLPAASVTSLSLDSRQIRPGGLFIGLRGSRVQGADFIDDALARGAAAVVVETERAAELSFRGAVPLVQVPNLRARVSEIAARFYDFPSRAMWVAGITGTNGKTSCTWWLQQLLGLCGVRAVSLGTLGLASGTDYQPDPQGLTTADAVRVQALLADLRQQGIEAVAMEVSSHGLDQRRVEAVDFDLAIFTNLSQDHLDYHTDMAAYGCAKRRLFELPSVRQGLINLDDPFGGALMERLRGSLQLLSYGHSATADIRVRNSQVGQSLEADLDTPWGDVRIANPRILGEFNLDNLLAVLGAACLQGVPLAQAAAAVADLTPVPGRLEVISTEQDDIHVVVDFAHTPAAVTSVLRLLRQHAGGRLLCVLGAGGDRDPGKRPLMAAAALEQADQLIITSDNPRNEDPVRIAADMAAGVTGRDGYQILLDRAEAISAAISSARSGDTLAILGKGHETGQQFGDRTLPFSDQQQARKALQERRGGTA